MLDKVGKNFQIIRKIKKGSFSEIYKAFNPKTNLEVAVKVELANTEYQQLIYEYRLYKYLHNNANLIDKGIPNVYYCSTEGSFLLIKG
jgi:casein kinase 1